MPQPGFFDLDERYERRWNRVKGYRLPELAAGG
jgi:hypothetical protein